MRTCFACWAREVPQDHYLDCVRAPWWLLYRVFWLELTLGLMEGKHG